MVKQIIDFTQKQLSGLYRYDSKCKISDYLVSDEKLDELRQICEPDNNVDEINGCVWLFNKDDKAYSETKRFMGFGLAYYLSPKVREALGSNNPIGYLGPENYSDYLTLVEETSHANLFMLNIAKNKSFSLFEMELQAMIDKFTLTFVNVVRLNHGAIPIEYMELFLDDKVELLGKATSELKTRLEDANYYSSIFCKYLLTEHIQKKFDKNKFKSDLMDFYYADVPGKIEQINRTF